MILQFRLLYILEQLRCCLLGLFFKSLQKINGHVAVVHLLGQKDVGFEGTLALRTPHRHLLAQVDFILRPQVY